MAVSTPPQVEPPSPGVKQPAPLAREAGAVTAYPTAVLANDWLRPAVVLGVLALLLAAFHGVRQEIKDVRQEIKDVRQEIQGVRQEIQGVRLEFKADLQAVETRLRADNRAVEEKLDRVLDTLRQP